VNKTRVKISPKHSVIQVVKSTHHDVVSRLVDKGYTFHQERISLSLGITVAEDFFSPLGEALFHLGIAIGGLYWAH
jgi:hypothetical protein